MTAVLGNGSLVRVRDGACFLEGVVVRYGPGRLGADLGGATLRLRCGEMAVLGRDPELVGVADRWAPREPPEFPLRPGNGQDAEPDGDFVRAYAGEWVKAAAVEGAGSYQELVIAVGRLVRFEPLDGPPARSFRSAVIEGDDASYCLADGWFVDVFSTRPHSCVVTRTPAS